jgi:hypothetical protein
MPCCKHIIADYVPHIPWIEDLLGTFLSFCPIVSQNPTLVHIVSSLPDCPVLLGLTLSPFLMGREGRGQHLATLFLHSKHLYSTPQGLYPSFSTPSCTIICQL